MNIRLLLLTCTLAVSVSVLNASDAEGFERPLVLDWSTANLSQPTGSQGWAVSGTLSDGGTELISPRTGRQMAFASFNATITSAPGTISAWLISPTYFDVGANDRVTFWTRTVSGSTFPDRLEVRISTSGESYSLGASATDVGSFSQVILTINPALSVGGYPEVWTRYEIPLSVLSNKADIRIAFRYYVTDGGGGSNSYLIGLDDVELIRESGQVVPKFTSQALNPDGSVMLEFSSIPDRYYRLEYSADLMNWIILNDEVPSQGKKSLVADAGNDFASPRITRGMSNDSRRFWRIVDLGRQRYPRPNVVITNLSNASNVSGVFSVNAAATTVLGTPAPSTMTLYIDGEAIDEIGIGANGQALVNSTNWRNGPHTIFVASRDAGGGSINTAPQDQQDTRPAIGISEPIVVNFTNFVSEVSYSNRLFRPEEGQSNRITAKLEEESMWLLEISDEASAAIVRTFSGTGSRISVVWDGRDSSGNLVPPSEYSYRVSYNSVAPKPLLNELAVTGTTSISGSRTGERRVGARGTYAIGASTNYHYQEDILNGRRYLSAFERQFASRFGLKRAYPAQPISSAYPNTPLQEILGQDYFGQSMLNAGDIALLHFHGASSNGNRLFQLPFNANILMNSGFIVHGSRAEGQPRSGVFDDDIDVPIAAMQIGEPSTLQPINRPGAVWAFITACAVFEGDLNSSMSTPRQMAGNFTYPMFGTYLRGMCGFRSDARNYLDFPRNVSLYWSKNSPVGQLSVVDGWIAASLQYLDSNPRAAYAIGFRDSKIDDLSRIPTFGIPQYEDNLAPLP